MTTPTMRHYLAVILFLVALALAGCDDTSGSVNPGTYPCKSQIAPCLTPTPQP